MPTLSAVTLATFDMRRAIAFHELLGFRRVHGGARAGLTDPDGHQLSFAQPLQGGRAPPKR